MNFRFLFREMLHSRSQAAVFVLCVALSLVSIVAINSLRRDVRMSIVSDARSLHGGDVIVHSHYDLSPPLKLEITTLKKEMTLQSVRTWEFYSVARRTDGGDSLFCNIKAVEPGYPLYGRVELLSGQDFTTVMRPGKAVVAAALLERLGLVVGDRLLLGSSSVEIVDVVSRESLRPVDFFNFGPRILVHADDLDQMDLVKKGSRVHYNLLIKIDDPLLIDITAARLQEKAVTGQERVATYASASSRVKRFFDNLLFFLSLISVFTLLLAGIGMQSSLAALLRRKEKSFAILRSLGATGSFLLRHYLGIVLILSSIGSSLGIMLGLILEKSFSSLFAGLLPDNIILGASIWDIIEGMGLGLVVVSFFTFLPLNGIKEIKPASVFRKETTPGFKRPTTYVLIFCGIVLFTGLVVRQLEDVQTGLYFMGGVLGLILLIALLVSALVLLGRRFNVDSLVLRQAARSMLRPGNATRSVVITLASALSVLLAIYLVEHNLHGTYIASYPSDAPNLFCLDIQKDQQLKFIELVGADVELFPVIRARLTAINGKKIHRKEELKKRGDSLAREFNLTYRKHLLEDEVFTRGDSLFGGDKPKDSLVQVSVLDTVADMGDMKIGDVLDFNIQGVPLKAQVSSIRSRTKSMLYPFFYFVFPEKYLREAPQTFFGALKVDKEDVAKLENSIVNSFPNISTINVGETAVELGKMMEKLSRIINFFSFFSILAGALILVSSILATRMARIKEVVYYKILGAGSRFVVQVFFFENLLIALLSGLCAVVVAQIGSWWLCHFLLRITYDPSWPACFLLLLMTVCLVVGLGLLSSVSIIRQKPIRFLREQG